MGINPSDLPPKIRRQYVKELASQKTIRPDQTQSEALLESQIKNMRLPGAQRNFRLADSIGRKWEADFAWVEREDSNWSSAPRQSLFVFLDGQVHAISRKRTADCERDNVLSLCSRNHWTIFKFTPAQVRSLVAVDTIDAWFSGDLPAVLAALQRKQGR